MSTIDLKLSPNNKIHAFAKHPTVVWTAKPTKPTDLSVLAFIVTIFFNHIFGFIAYYFTASSKHSWELNDYKKSKQHYRYAKIFIILGIIFGIATYAIAISLYITLRSDSTCSPPSSGGSSSQINGNLKTDSKARTTPTTTSMETTTAPVNVTCCQHCPLLTNPTQGPQGPQGKHGGTKTVLAPNTCDIYCTGGAGPIYPDLTQTYNDCCLELTCYNVFG